MGSADQVADDLTGWFRAGAADGFTVMFADTAVDLPAFARSVVPLLVERGVFRPAEPGTTLRARLGLAPSTRSAAVSGTAGPGSAERLAVGAVRSWPART